MSIEQTVEKVPDAIRPRCPHCKADPLKVKRLRYDFPDGVVTEAVFCSNLECRCVLSIVFVGYEKPKPQQPQQ